MIVALRSLRVAHVPDVQWPDYPAVGDVLYTHAQNRLLAISDGKRWVFDYPFTLSPVRELFVWLHESNVRMTPPVIAHAALGQHAVQVLLHAYAPLYRVGATRGRAAREVLARTIAQAVLRKVCA